MLQKTKNYSLFSSFTANREVNENHVKQLARSIQENNLLHLNPIIVNSNYQIIDGQHRLEAAQVVGAEIYFLIDDKVRDEDISILNSKKLTWKHIDYINFWTIKKRPGFDILSKHIAENPILPITTMIRLLSGHESGGTKSVAEGYCSVANEPAAIEILAILNDYSNYCSFWNSSKFIRAIQMVHSTGLYKHSLMKDKLEFQRRSLVPCITTKQYVEMIEEIYNYRNSTNRVRFI